MIPSVNGLLNGLHVCGAVKNFPFKQTPKQREVHDEVPLTSSQGCEARRVSF
jgi:hypothetical protein